MKEELVYECWCVLVMKLKIYKNKIEIGSFFGMFTTTIPIQRLASVSNTLFGIVLETTGGGKTTPFSPWKNSNTKIIVNTILELIEKN